MGLFIAQGLNIPWPGLHFSFWLRVIELQTGRTFGDHLVQASETGGLDMFHLTHYFLFLFLLDHLYLKIKDMNTFFTFMFSTFCIISYHNHHFIHYIIHLTFQTSMRYLILVLPIFCLPVHQNSSSLYLWSLILSLTHSTQPSFHPLLISQRWTMTFIWQNLVSSSDLRPSSLIFRTTFSLSSSYFSASLAVSFFWFLCIFLTSKY